MRRPIRSIVSPSFLIFPALISLGLSGCGDTSRTLPPPPPHLRSGPLPGPITKRGVANLPISKSALGKTDRPASAEDLARSEEILKNVITLVQTAVTNPGGSNFDIAIKNLNHYFERGTTAADFAMPIDSKRFLLRQLPPELVADLEAPVYTLRDARHLEDCMLYNAIASRVAGEGDDLTRVQRLFDWTIRQVQLVPAQSLAPNGMEQAQVRPYDCLLRGMATESQGYWAERGWVFMSLCRQIGIDVGILSYERPKPSMLMTKPANRNDDPPVFWITTALINKKLYLFDAQLGLAIPSADGKGIATLDEAIDDPRILDRLDLPGQFRYETKARDLRLSPTKVGILIDASSGYLSPRSRLLQKRLTGKNRTILHRDPAEQRAKFIEALGPNAGEITAWLLPLQVETNLFKSAQFVAATQASLILFKGELPLLHARILQLRGEVAEAIQEYVALRFAQNALMKDKKTPIIPEVQNALDAYATYFLGQCHLDLGNADQAKLMFLQILKRLPEPGPGRNAYYMFRWGAESNLGRINDAQGNRSQAITYYSQPNPTNQAPGNFLRARDLIWSNPMRPIQPPLPPAPLGQTNGAASAAAAVNP